MNKKLGELDYVAMVYLLLTVFDVEERQWIARALGAFEAIGDHVNQ